MMKILALIFSFIVFYPLSVKAQPFYYTTFENPSFRDFSSEELLTSLGDNHRWLNLYSCSSLSHHDWLWISPRQNSKEDSFFIQGEDERRFIYQKGKLFQINGKQIKKTSDPFIKIAWNNLLMIEKLNAGKKLLRALEQSPYSLTLRKGMNSFAPTLEGGRTYHGMKMAQAIFIIDRLRTSDDLAPFSDIGVGGYINWNPRDEGLSIEEDLKKRASKPVISLAHELYHAFDSIRGLLDLSFVTGEEYEFSSRSEYRAVYFENLIRKELGLKYRMYYGATEGPGMLDDKLEPIYIPAPCLSGLIER